MSKFKTPNNKNICEICIKLEVHIFNVRTIIMESLNIKEWILLELQIKISHFS